MPSAEAEILLNPHPCINSRVVNMFAVAGKNITEPNPGDFNRVLVSVKY